MHYVALFTTDYLTTVGFVHFFNSRAGSREEEIDLAHPPLRIFARLFTRRARTRSIRTGWDPVHGTISLWRYSFSDTSHSSSREKYFSSPVLLSLFLGSRRSR